jgi:hypothetical protein
LGTRGIGNERERKRFSRRSEAFKYGDLKGGGFAIQM